MNEINYFSN